MEFMNCERTLQEAARRCARLHAIDCTQAERDDTAQWQAESPEHRRACELAERVFAGASALAQDERLGQKLRALADAAYAAPAISPATHARPARSARRWRLAASLAAGFVIAVLAVRYSAPRLADSPELVTYEFTGNERRAVKLADGSTVELDVNTRVAIRMSPERRQVELISGRAFFEVAHDAGRPFSVTASGARTTALGTKFQVKRDDANVEVILAQGSVAIDRGERESTGEAWSERLSPGEQIDIDTATQRRERRTVDVNAAMSWTRGRHIFRGTPLHTAIDEVNRYADRKIRLGDASLANLPVAGNFVVGDSEVIVDAFAAVLPLRVVNGDRDIILLRSRSP
jgi:transmembrane sensor